MLSLKLTFRLTILGRKEVLALVCGASRGNITINIFRFALGRTFFTDLNYFIRRSSKLLLDLVQILGGKRLRQLNLVHNLNLRVNLVHHVLSASVHVLRRYINRLLISDESGRFRAIESVSRR